MGCGISKFDEEEIGPSGGFKPGTKRNDHNDHHHQQQHYGSPIKEGRSTHVDIKRETINASAVADDDDDVDSLLANNGRKSVSVSLLPNEKVFARKTKRENEDERGGSEEEGGGGDSIMYPGSPSFREYCVDDTTEIRNAGSGNEDKSYDKSRKGSSETQPLKNRRKGRRIKNVLNKGGFKS